MSTFNTNIPNPQIKPSEGKKLYDVSVPVEIPKPEISITYLEANHNEYGLKGFSKKAKKTNDSNLYIELEKFLKSVRGYKSIQELIDMHCPKNGTKSNDEYSSKVMKKIKKEYDIDTSDMLHIHLKVGGKGAFVLHGFIIKNCFEIVLIDPFHEIHKS